MVAESILRIPLEDLKTIRIKCPACGLVTEGPFTEQNEVILHGRCTCGNQLDDKRSEGSHLFQLASLVRLFIKNKDKIGIEFVISDNS